MSAPYRDAAPSEGPPPPPQLVYVARERDMNAAFHRVWIRTLLFGVGGALLAAGLGVPSAGLAVILGVLVWSLFSWRRTRGGDAIVFRVERGDLLVSRRNGRERILALPLRTLRDVTLDTRSVTPVMRNTSTESMGIGASVRGEIDVSRVLLVPQAPRESVSLSEEHLAHMDAVEGAGKIRSFLRKHGWLPEDERALVTPEEDRA